MIGKKQRFTLRVDGMTCGGCAANVDKALRGVSGVKDVAVDLDAGAAAVTAARADGDTLVAAVEAAGYPASIKAD